MRDYIVNFKTQKTILQDKPTLEVLVTTSTTINV